ncbi:MAG: 3-oxoadipate enol-lactonase [Actinomycetota bacterium]|jgi:pimeloyl-ACP methyl ester carboxylesterase|nr:3-oxoadipate enol-lactonase [Actinomycetota bacterium]
MRIRASDHETTVTVRATRGPAEGRRVFAYDVRGHGTAADAPKPFTMAGTAADLVAVLDALELETAHVAGLSLGGAIAQAAAVAAPERFASLTLMAAPDRPVPEAFEERARVAETEGMAALVEPTLERWFTAAALAADTEGVRYARDCVASFEPATWASIWRGYGGLDVYERLRDFTAPAPAIAGGADASIPVDGMAAIAARIGDGARSRCCPVRRTSRRWNAPKRWPTPWAGSSPRRSTSRNLGGCLATWNR